MNKYDFGRDDYQDYDPAELECRINVRPHYAFNSHTYRRGGTLFHSCNFGQSVDLT